MPHRLKPLNHGLAADQADFPLGTGAAVENGDFHRCEEARSHKPQARRGSIATFWLLATGLWLLSLGPNLHFALERDLVLFVDLLADDLDQLVDVLGAAARMGDDEVGVLGTH